MAIYKGNVSVVLNTSNQITLQNDADGAFNSDNASELNDEMLNQCKLMKAEYLEGNDKNVDLKGDEPTIDPWARYIVEGGTEWRLNVARFGKPKLCFVKPSNSTKKRVIKLA